MWMRVTWKVASYGPVQVMGFNETNGIWVRDQIN